MKRSFVSCASLVALALSLAACVTPTTVTPLVDDASAKAEAKAQAALIWKSHTAERARVAAVAERLFLANVADCENRHRVAGFATLSVMEAPPPYQSAAREAGLGDRKATVTWLYPSGPADKAGLKLGDEITAVGVIPVTDGRPAPLIRTALDGQKPEIDLGVMRDGKPLALSVKPDWACAVELKIVDNQEINASTDGKTIAINHGLLRFVPKDEELALVIAHELAHGTEHHLRARQMNMTAGMAGGLVLDVLAAAGGVNTGGAFMKAGGQMGSGFASPEFEAEADYVGVYYMTRAGFSTEGVEDLWRRIAVENPHATFVTSDHPSSPRRYLAIARAREEIAAKQKAGEPLTPSRKRPSTPPKP